MTSSSGSDRIVDMAGGHQGENHKDVRGTMVRIPGEVTVEGTDSSATRKVTFGGKTLSHHVSQSRNPSRGVEIKSQMARTVK